MIVYILFLPKSIVSPALAFLIASEISLSESPDTTISSETISFSAVEAILSTSADADTALTETAINKIKRNQNFTIIHYIPIFSLNLKTNIKFKHNTSQLLHMFDVQYKSYRFLNFIYNLLF